MNRIGYAAMGAIARRSSLLWRALPARLRDWWAEEWMRRTLVDRYIPESDR